MSIAMDYNIDNISRVAGEIRLGRCLAPVLTGENWDDLMDCYKRYVRMTEETEEDGELCDDDSSEILEKYHGCFRKILQAIHDECSKYNDQLGSN